jgi:hypothetical protein
MLKLVPPYKLTARLDPYDGQWKVTPKFSGTPSSPSNYGNWKGWHGRAMKAVAEEKAKILAESQDQTLPP